MKLNTRITLNSSRPWVFELESTFIAWVFKLEYFYNSSIQLSIHEYYVIQLHPCGHEHRRSRLRRVLLVPKIKHIPPPQLVCDMVCVFAKADLLGRDLMAPFPGAGSRLYLVGSLGQLQISNTNSTINDKWQVGVAICKYIG